MRWQQGAIFGLSVLAGVVMAVILLLGVSAPGHAHAQDTATPTETSTPTPTQDAGAPTETSTPVPTTPTPTATPTQDPGAPTETSTPVPPTPTATAIPTPDCDNEFLTQACEWGCHAAEGVCGWGCGAGKDICKAGCNAAEEVCEWGCGVAEGGCHFGCDVAWGWCHWLGLCDNKYHRCHNSCDLDCDSCKLDCENECEWDCSSCILQCEEDCQFPCALLGESCNPVDPGFGTACAEGLRCLPTFGMDEFNNNWFTCIPYKTETPFPDAFCRDMYVRQLHEAAMFIDWAMTIGVSFNAGALVGTVLEAGTAYGPDGCYGCYFTDCWGGVTDLEIGLSACAGVYGSLDLLAGESQMVVENAGEIFIGTLTQVFDIFGLEYYGSQVCVGIGISAVPGSIGVYSCSTMLDVACCMDEYGNCIEVANNPPTALCTDVSTCADEDTCVADASIDNGSFDPDGDSILLNQSPPEPYDIGERTVTLQVSDPYGSFATCNAQVVVNDCTAPDIVCPAPTTAECESAEQAIVDPGDAVASDCSDVTVTDPGPASYPLGDTLVTYTATDTSGNSSSCDTTVSVVDTTAPEISCNSRDIVPPDAPISFTATGDDLCDEVTVEITGFDCYKFTQKGERVDKTESCVVEIDGDSVTIVDSGGVDTNIEWTVVATDASGNSSSEVCSLTVQNPGRGSNQ